MLLIFDVFLIILPLFAAIGAGFGLSKAFKIDENSLTRVLTDFFMPALVFYSLYSSDVVASETFRLLAATTMAVAMLALLAFIYCRITGISPRGFVPPVCFMNSGFIGIPLMALWGGAAALNVDVIIDQMQTFYIFTLGILIVSGGLRTSGLKEMVKAPLLWAIAAGFFFKFTGIRINDSVMEIFRFGGTGASALAAFTVGCAVSSRKLVFNRHLAAGLLLRFGGGLAAGLAASAVFGLTGLSRTVMIVATGLPSAVFSYVLPLRYGADADLAGSMVVVSTAAGIIVIPMLFIIAGL